MGLAAAATAAEAADLANVLQAALADALQQCMCVHIGGLQLDAESLRLLQKPLLCAPRAPNTLKAFFAFKSHTPRGMRTSIKMCLPAHDGLRDVPSVLLQVLRHPTC